MHDLSEEEIYEGMGLEPPAPPPAADDPASAAPAENSAPEETGGADETERVAAESAPEVPAQPPVTTNDGTTPPVQEEPPASLSAEERPGQSIETQQRERQALEDKIYAEANIGKLNPYTGRPILSKADYEQYQRDFETDQQRQRMEVLRQSGIDPEVISGMIGSHPAVQQAQQVMREAAEAKQRAQAAEATAWYGEQVKAITALDPTVKSLDDLCARAPDQYPKIMELVSRGVSLVDAYKTMNFDAIAQRRAEAAAQSARNQVSGKAHLEPTGGQGKAGVEIPAGVAEEYRALNPDMTDAEIRKDYEAYLKQVEARP